MTVIIEPIIEVYYEETTTVTNYTEYLKAYEWVVDNMDEGFFLYTIFECENDAIDLRYFLSGKTIERRDLGILAVITDIVIMTFFLFAIWTISYLVRLDSERHKNLLFETKEFSVIVDNLPKITSIFTVEDMKAELWDHF